MLVCSQAWQLMQRLDSSLNMIHLHLQVLQIALVLHSLSCIQDLLWAHCARQCGCWIIQQSYQNPSGHRCAEHKKAKSVWSVSWLHALCCMMSVRTQFKDKCWVQTRVATAPSQHGYLVHKYAVAVLIAAGHSRVDCDNRAPARNV